MSTPRLRAPRVLAGLLGLLLIPAPVLAQGLGVGVALGGYASLVADDGGPSAGGGFELTGRWAFPSGIGIGLGARYVGFRYEWDRASLFAEARYAPIPTTQRRLRPVVGLRVGPYYGGGGDGDGNPLFGLEAAGLIGVSLRAGPGLSVTALGDLGLVLSDNETVRRHRRFFPGVQVGLVLH